MMSPAKRHRHKTQAAHGAASVAAKNGAPVDANLYELMLMQLADHKRSLKEIQSVERKVEAKRHMLPEYAAYVDGILQADAGRQDDVVMTMMVWSVDVGDYARAIQIGAYALKHGLTTPEQYNRDTATLLTEEIAEARLRGGDVSVLDLMQTDQLTEGRDMPDEVRAKLKRAIGEAYGEDNPDIAVKYLERAIELNKNIGVKKLLDSLKRKAKAAADATAVPPTEAAPDEAAGD